MGSRDTTPSLDGRASAPSAGITYTSEELREYRRRQQISRREAKLRIIVGAGLTFAAELCGVLFVSDIF